MGSNETMENLLEAAESGTVQDFSGLFLTASLDLKERQDCLIAIIRRGGSHAIDILHNVFILMSGFRHAFDQAEVLKAVIVKDDILVLQYLMNYDFVFLFLRGQMDVSTYRTDNPLVMVKSLGMASMLMSSIMVKAGRYGEVPEQCFNGSIWASHFIQGSESIAIFRTVLAGNQSIAEGIKTTLFI